MDTTLIQAGIPSLRSAPIGASPRDPGDFAGLLARVTPASNAGSSVEERAREAAASFVATVFVAPVFKMLRESGGAAPPFAPTNAEKQFQSMLDSRLSEDVVRSARFPLVDRIAADLLRAGGYKRSGNGVRE